MAENLGEARLRLTADSKNLDKTLKRVGQQTQKIGIAMAGVGVAIAAPLAAAVKVFAEYEQSMAQVQAVSGATVEEFGALDAIAREMGRTTVFTARESAQALGFMAMAGLEAKESIAALPDVLYLAAAGQLELGQSADIVTNVMAGYGIAAGDVTMAVDVLTKGFTSANTDLVQLGEAFKLGGPVAKAAGLEFEETAAALALMGNAGFQGTLSGTALRGAITRLLNPTDEAGNALARMGVQATDAEGNLLPLNDIVAQLEEAGLSAGDAMTIFGQRAGPAMLALLEQGSGALADLTEEMRNAGGTAQTIADTQLDTLTGDITLLKSAFEGIAITIGSVIAPRLREIMEVLTPLIQRVGEWAEANPELTKKLVILGVAVAAIAIVLGTLLIGVGLVATGLTLLASGPVLLAIAGFAGLLAGIVAMIMKWDELQPAIERLQPVLQALMTGDIQPLIVLLNEGLNVAIEATKAKFTELQATAAEQMEAMRMVVVEKMEAMRTAVAENMEAIQTTISEQMEAIQPVVTEKMIAIATAITDQFGIAMDVVNTKIGDLTTTISETLMPVLEPLGTFFTDTMNPAIDGAKDAFAFLREKLTPLEPLIKNLEGIAIAFGVALALMLLPISGPVGLVIMLGKFALKFIDIEKVFEALKPLMTWFTDTVMPRIKEVWENTVKPALEAFWSFLKQQLVSAWEDYLKPALEALTAFFNDTIAPAIQAGIDAFKALFDYVTGDFTGVGESAGETGSAITDQLGKVWDFFTDKLLPIFKELAEFVWPLIVEVWEESLKPTFDQLVDYFDNVITPAMQKLWDFFVLAWETIDSSVVAILKTFAIVVEGIIDGVFSAIRILLKLFQGDWEGAWNEVKRFFSEIWESLGRIFEAWKTPFGEAWNGIVNIAKAAVNKIIGFINGIIDAWNSISFRLPSIKIPGISVPAPTLKNPFATKKIGGGSFGGQTFRVPQIPRIPQLAEGGIVTSPMLAQIAEREPEAVIPLSKLGGMAGGGTQVHIYAENLYGYEDFIDAVRQANLEGDRLGIGVA